MGREYHRAKEDSRLAQNNLKIQLFIKHAKRRFQHNPKCIRTIGLHPVNLGSEYQLIKCYRKILDLIKIIKRFQLLGQYAKKEVST